MLLSFKYFSTPIKAVAEILSSKNLDLMNPLSVICVFVSIQMKSPLQIPNFSTSAFECTTSSIRTSIVSSFLSNVEASGYTCTLGEQERIVPVYTFPSRV